VGRQGRTRRSPKLKEFRGLQRIECDPECDG
jgi:hypothetical protein